MNKTKKIIIAVVAAVLVVAAVVTVVLVKGKKKDSDIVANDTTPSVYEEENVTSEINSYYETLTDTETTTEAVDETTTKAPDYSGMNKSQIISFYVDAVNKTKQYSGSLSVHRVEKYDIEIKDCTGGTPVVNMANRVIGAILSPADENLTFNNGKAKNSSGKDVGLLLPESKLTSVPESGVADAKIAYDGTNTAIDIYLAPEAASLTQAPVVHSACIDTFSSDLLDLNFIQLTNFNYNYTGTTIHAVITPDGYVRTAEYSIPVNIDATGKVVVATGNAVVDCNQMINWEISW